MDIPVKINRRPAQLRAAAMTVAVAGVLGLGWYALQSSFSNDSVALAEFVTGTVTRGELLRDVRAPGSLEPTDLRWL
ncbi:MAG: hypothetical protein V4603_09540, partial [Pseudomonadota bacterium]